MITPQKLIWAFVCSFLAPVAYDLVIALRKGYVRSYGRYIHRQEEPSGYWAIVILMTVFWVVALWVGILGFLRA